jgi:lysophospholipase L1-like esterase
VIIWGFINDVFRSTPEEVEAKLVRSRDNLNTMIEKARSKGIIPIVATEVTLPVGDSWSDRIAGWVGTLRGKQGYQDYINGHVVEMNHWVRRIAAEKKLTVLDFEKVLADSKGRRKPEYATQDGTHLSPQAYEALTDYTKRMNLGI